MNDKELADLIRQVVVKEIGGGKAGGATSPTLPAPSGGASAQQADKPGKSGRAGQGAPAPVRRTEHAASPEDIALAKRVAAWMGAEVPPSPWFGAWQAAGDRTHYLSRTPARLAVGRAGTRYRTDTLLDFLTDHAAARDAVQDNLAADMMSKLGLVPIKSAATDKREYLVRPDLGRRLCDDSVAVVQQRGSKSPQVQIVVGDGLSATAINVNLPVLLPIVEQELKRNGIRLGTTFAVSNGRVACGDQVARLTDADVLCMLVGERPGLKTAESMGAYITYMKVARFNEAMRVVVSNIHKGGLPPDGEGAQLIVQTCLKALRDRKTGVEVK
ncbi:MAG: ethanolamine ammonia-lyase subunit EutC [Deltaproteobacteria bacterium]|nr:ethanolamine ammonia-lyase subunit EutC [Deltaproteobacteria bacterium]